MEGSYRTGIVIIRDSFNSSLKCIPLCTYIHPELLNRMKKTKRPE